MERALRPLRNRWRRSLDGLVGPFGPVTDVPRMWDVIRYRDDSTSDCTLLVLHLPANRKPASSRVPTSSERRRKQRLSESMVVRGTDSKCHSGD